METPLFPTSKAELQDAIPAQSDVIEPAIEHILGVMGSRLLAACRGGDVNTVQTAARELWAMLDLIFLQQVLLGNATHAALVTSNLRVKVAGMIFDLVGVHPIRDRAKFVDFTAGFAVHDWTIDRAMVEKLAEASTD